MKIINNLIRKLIALWKAETPMLARLLQVICIALVFMPTYFSTLPDEFRQAFTTGEVKTTAVLAVIAAVILNFTTKKTK